MMADLNDYEKLAAANPEWEKAGRVHDWRNHVPDEIRAIWSTFTAEQQYELYRWADEIASNEHWD